jgi:hypothetical protein
MKKITLSILSCLLLAAVYGQQPAHNDHDGHNHAPATPVAADDALGLVQTEYDFGNIAQNKPVYYTFEFVNKGKTELKLDNVQASCGCTTPEWSKEPVAPGAKGTIKVGYNAAAEGAFDKFITITYNNQSRQIRIKGHVWKAPEGPAPANASINLLKKQSF